MGGWYRGGVILRAAEASGILGMRVGPGRNHPLGGGGSRSTGREDGTEEVSSSGIRRLAVHAKVSSFSGRRRHADHREEGCDRGGVVILFAAEARGPPGGRV